MKKTITKGMRETGKNFGMKEQMKKQTIKEDNNNRTKSRKKTERKLRKQKEKSKMLEEDKEQYDYASINKYTKKGDNSQVMNKPENRERD